LQRLSRAGRELGRGDELRVDMAHAAELASYRVVRTNRGRRGMATTGSLTEGGYLEFFRKLGKTGMTIFNMARFCWYLAGHG